ncbi:MAG: YgjP-like metallopeptidase domain-containing protein [Pseudomonadota bacterium]
MTARDLAVIQPPSPHGRFRQYRFTLRRNSAKAWPELQWRHREGRVTLRMPRAMCLDDCFAAFNRCVPWFDRFAQRGDTVLTLRIDDQPHALVQTPGLKQYMAVSEGQVRFRPGPPASMIKALKRLIEQRTRLSMQRYVIEKAEMIGIAPGRMRLSSAQRKWGACDPQNNLTFSWRLSMGPPFVQEYLAAHEVAHFRHKHHKSSFWEEVNRLMPRWPIAEQWLAFCGPTLMATDIGSIAARALPHPAPQAHRAEFSQQ